MAVPSIVQTEKANLADALDRILHRGAVLRGEVVISVADVDLLYLDLRLFLSSIDTAMRSGMLPSPGVSMHERPVSEKARHD